MLFLIYKFEIFDICQPHPSLNAFPTNVSVIKCIAFDYIIKWHGCRSDNGKEIKIESIDIIT